VLGLLLRLPRRSRGAGSALVVLSAAGFLIVLFVPVGQMLLRPLEDRFPIPAVTGADGIVVLAGVTREETTLARNAVALNSGAERLTVTAELARRFPAARIVIAGGSGSIGGSLVSESATMRRFLVEQGIDAGRIAIDESSRNTAENAAFARQLADPQPGQTWLLVTSAYHMPRSVGSFRAVGWNVVPYPVGFLTPDAHTRHLAPNLVLLGIAEKEWVGLLAYYLTGRSAELMPGPEA
jgi:uncharacterized SAM-binding protein YcdF (DUF218 family)